jgi:hypothetical protein
MACWIEGAAARAKVLVVGRVAADARRLACGGAVARTLLNILAVCVCDGVVVVERFCSVVWMVVGDVVVERCLRSAAIVNLNWGKWIGFCDEVTSARDFRVPSFPRASLFVRCRRAESTRVRVGVSSIISFTMKMCCKIVHNQSLVNRSSALHSPVGCK